MNEIFVIGVSHHTAPVGVRECFSLARPQAESPLIDLLPQKSINGLVLLSTCNRMEIYASTDDFPACREVLTHFLCRFSSTPKAELAPLLYQFSGTQAAEHLFRVASSLDSLVPGETQISGQVKQAYLASLYGGAEDPLINHLFQQAFGVAKRIRRETGIGRLAISVSSVAVEFIRRQQPDLTRQQVIIIGAGEMAEQAAEALYKAGVSEILVANRTFARSAELASRIGGRACDFADIPLLIRSADIVIASTFAIHHILTLADLEPIMKNRKKPLFILDISVPRCIDPEIGNLDLVTLADIDRLQELGAENLKSRMEEAKRAEIIIIRETEKFTRWQRERAAAPLISALHEQAEAIRQKELARTLSQLGQPDGLTPEILDRLTRVLVRKLLLAPTRALREEALLNGSSKFLQAFQKLFELEVPSESDSPRQKRE